MSVDPDARPAPDDADAEAGDAASADGRGFLRRRGLLLASYAAVVLAIYYIAKAFNQQRTFRLDSRGLVRTAAYPDAPFASFAELQERLRAEGWTVEPRRADPLEVRTTWLGDKRLRVLLDEWRVPPAGR